jgi:hypothetical protein
MSISKVGPWVLSVAALCVAVAAYVEARRRPTEIGVEALAIHDKAGVNRLVLSVLDDTPSVTLIRPDTSISAVLSGGEAQDGMSSLALFGADGKSQLTLFGSEQAVIGSRKKNGFSAMVDIEKNQRVYFGPDGKPSFGPGPIESAP